MADQAENLRKLVKEKSANGRKTKIITIASGKGGVGKTNLAINLAIAFHQLEKNVVVMDADLGLANVNVILGVIPKYNLYHVIKGAKSIKEILIETKDGIKIIAGASGFSQLANLTHEQRENFIQGLDDLSFADIIIIDTGAGVSDNVLQFVLAADEVIIITTPEPTSITDAYGIIKSISSEAMSTSIKLVVNRVGTVVEGRKVADRIINIAGQFLNIKVDNLGFVYEDKIVGQSVLKQRPFITHGPKSKAAACVHHIAQKLANVDGLQPGGFNGFLRKLFAVKPKEIV